LLAWRSPSVSSCWSGSYDAEGSVGPDEPRVKIVQGEYRCPRCGTFKSCRVVVDDGLPPGESDADTLRSAALRHWQESGGWACSANGCEYRWPLTGDLLRRIVRVAGERDHDGFAGESVVDGGEGGSALSKARGTTYLTPERSRSPWRLI
jgi:hypothetical protein